MALFGLAASASSVFANEESQRELRAQLEEEIKLARAIFETEEDVVAARVYGLICESCAYGLRLKFKQLKSVDTKRLAKGIKLDVYNQLLTIALKPGSQIGVNEIYRAILEAGYEPKTLFMMDSVESVLADNAFTLAGSQGIRFELADSSQADLMEHGRERKLLVVAPAVSAERVETLKAYLVDTIHEDLADGS